MTELFLAGISFALELIAFSIGATFIVWALRAQTTHPSGAASAKLAGSFIIVLSTVALIGTSYYGAKVWLRGDARPSMSKSMGKDWQGRMMNKSDKAHHN